MKHTYGQRAQVFTVQHIFVRLQGVAKECILNNTRESHMYIRIFKLQTTKYIDMMSKFLFHFVLIYFTIHSQAKAKIITHSQIPMQWIY